MNYKFEKASTYFTEKRLLEVSVMAFEYVLPLMDEFKSIDGHSIVHEIGDLYDRISNTMYEISDDIIVTKEYYKSAGRLPTISLYLYNDKDDWELISYLCGEMESSRIHLNSYSLFQIENSKVCYRGYNSNDEAVILEFNPILSKDEFFNLMIQCSINISYEVLISALRLEIPEGYHYRLFNF